MGRRVLGAALAALPLIVGCSWVALDPGAEEVRIATASEVAGCEVVGLVTAQTSDQAAIFARTPRKIDEELRALARNEAAGMGGDAVVAQGRPEKGRQLWDVYRCNPR